MTLSDKKLPRIEELNAQHDTVSGYKYGFFLCQCGTARISVGAQVYQISRNHLCIYTPNTFFQLLEKSPDLEGILVAEEVETYYPAIHSIDVQKRLQIRNAPCIQISAQQSESVAQLVHMVRESETTRHDNSSQHKTAGAIHEQYLRHLRYALCLKVVEVYFSNTPIASLSAGKEDLILNHFLASVYKNCHFKHTVQHYAAEQHLSPYYFSSIIKDRSGKSALQWIEHATMTFARQYLAYSEMSIKEISDCLNFPDQSTFGRYFKRREGCSPSEFRKRQSNKPI